MEEIPPGRHKSGPPVLVSTHSTFPGSRFRHVRLHLALLSESPAFRALCDGVPIQYRARPKQQKADLTADPGPTTDPAMCTSSL